MKIICGQCGAEGTKASTVECCGTPFHKEHCYETHSRDVHEQ